MKNSSFLIFIIALFGISCQQKSVYSGGLNEKIHEYNEKYKDSNISDLLHELGITEFKKNNFLIYIDANCGKCFEILLNWKNEIFSIYEGLDHIGYNFILSSNDKKITQFFLSEKINFPLEYVIYDQSVIPNNLSFMEDNYLFNTLIFDDHGYIVFVGSPFISTEIFRKIEKIIKA